MMDEVCPGDVKTIKEASIHGQFTKSELPDGGRAEFVAPVVWAPIIDCELEIIWEIPD
jgi:hypothetical protein